jgi:hypothetical protein
MLFLLCTVLVASFLFGRTAVQALDSSSTPLERRDDSNIQILTAINIRSELERRDVDFTPKYTWEHHYADRIYPPTIEEFHHSNRFALDVSLLHGASARFAKTSTRFKLPALALEDIESHLESVQCSDSVLVLDFMDELALRQAKGEWDGLSNFILISSHPSCNKDGERAPYV